ncbi:uncharacterized protein LOC134288355 [Aedes albopictus]|uniref:Uncharacterized protein n=1 Tax=Aedes albopictus TaxID=7160 RepID=A0ABM2A010_AEDAL
MSHAQNCAYVKCINQQVAENVVDHHNEQHQLEVKGVKYTVRLALDDESIQVKIHDLSESVSNDELAAYLRQYGDVHSVKELVWGPSFPYKGVSSGVREARMTLRNHIKSYVTVHGEETLVSYKNQVKSCRHCMQNIHPGKTCSNAKKETIKESPTKPLSASTTSQPSAPLQKSSQIKQPLQSSKRTANADNTNQANEAQTKSPPRKKTDRKQAVKITPTKQPDEQCVSEETDSDMETVSTVHLNTDTEPEPDPGDIDGWITRFDRRNRRLEQKIVAFELQNKTRRPE